MHACTSKHVQAVQLVQQCTPAVQHCTPAVQQNTPAVRQGSASRPGTKKINKVLERSMRLRPEAPALGQQNFVTPWKFQSLFWASLNNLSTQCTTLLCNHICTCTHTHMHLHTRTHHTYTQTHTYTHIHRGAGELNHTHTHTEVQESSLTHTYTHKHTQTHTRTHKHALTHTYTHRCRKAVGGLSKSIVQARRCGTRCGRTS